jgi:hypothetical protein
MPHCSHVPRAAPRVSAERLAERERITTVFTLDRRDFSLYRPARLGQFRIVP